MPAAVPRVCSKRTPTDPSHHGQPGRGVCESELYPFDGNSANNRSSSCSARVSQELAGEAGAQRNHAVGDACVVDGVVRRSESPAGSSAVSSSRSTAINWVCGVLLQSRRSGRKTPDVR